MHFSCSLCLVCDMSGKSWYSALLSHVGTDGSTHATDFSKKPSVLLIHELVVKYVFFWLGSEDSLTAVFLRVSGGGGTIIPLLLNTQTNWKGHLTASYLPLFLCQALIQNPKTTRNKQTKMHEQQSKEKKNTRSRRRKRRNNRSEQVHYRHIRTRDSGFLIAPQSIFINLNLTIKSWSHDFTPIVKVLEEAHKCESKKQNKTKNTSNTQIATFEG